MTYLTVEGAPRRLTLHEIASLAEDDIPVDAPLRLDIDLGHTILPLLVVRRSGADRLLVLSNGSVNLERSERRPVFQRSTWWQDLAPHQIYVCDPGTVGPEARSINWLQAPHPQWMVQDVSLAVVHLGRRLGIDAAEQRTYYGSSAGGFAALQLLAYDRRSRAIVNNPQIDWTRWHAHQVRPVLNACYPGMTAADVRRKHPRRSHALDGLARIKARARIDYWVNMASAHDRDVQLPVTMDFLQRHPQLCDEITLHTYYDEDQGHNPLSRPQTVDLLNRA